MSDEKEIRDLLAAYAIALDVDDFEGCLKLFADDGEFLVYGKTWAGGRIREMFARAPRGMHLCGATLVDLHGETATVRSQMLFVDSSTHLLKPTLYDDDLVKSGGRWQFRRRRCQFLTANGLSDIPQEQHS
ncbi:MAG: nuclear transport factor 2 family protein [Mycobacterium sp.]